MSDTIHIQIDRADGSLQRLIGLVERRGFHIDGLMLTDEGVMRRAAITVRGRDDEPLHRDPAPSDRPPDRRQPHRRRRHAVGGRVMGDVSRPVSRTAELAASDPNRVIVFDTTMRDGEQAPGFSMSTAAKLRMAEALRDLGVDVIESGFAAASPGDEEAMRRVAGEVEGPVFCSLSRVEREGHRRGAPRPVARAEDAPPLPHLPGDQPHPPLGQAAHEHRRGAGRRRALGGLRPHPVRRCGVLRRGRLPHRAGVSGRGDGGRRRRRGPDPERARHRRLRHAGRGAGALFRT